MENSHYQSDIYVNIADIYNNNISSIRGGAKIDFPPTNDADFQKKIAKIFGKYKITKRPTFKEICFPEKFTYQLPQLFVSEFINPKTPYKGLLLVHKIGAGKTCAAVQIAEQWKHKKKIIFVCPASLIGNIYKELRSQCAGNEYISEKERTLLNTYRPDSDEYESLLEKINKRINKYYTIISYNKFVDLSDRHKLNLDNALLIIDEVQNIVSEHGTYYHTFLREIKNAPHNMRVVIMSATPIFDKPIELALTINLLRAKEKEMIPVSSKFNETFLKAKKDKNGNIIYDIKNVNKLRRLLIGYISFYRGAPDHAFPKKIVKIVKCRMSPYQYSCYKAVEKQEGGLHMNDILKLPNNFFIGSRMISNVAFPDRLIKEDGYEAFTGKATREDLEKYSIKFFKILKNIKRCKGTCFVYSAFREFGGIQSFIRVLEHNGFKSFSGYGPGKNRYGVWSGSEDLSLKEMIKDYFNKKENEDGSMLKVILGSPAIKEGISLLRVRQIHVMEPYWNMSRLEQVIGRGIRFCSHKDMRPEDREVTVYIYLAVDPRNEKLTVDRHILNMAYEKDKLTKQFEQVIKESAVDTYLFNNI
jgi:hypothetical protein